MKKLLFILLIALLVLPTILLPAKADYVYENNGEALKSAVQDDVLNAQGATAGHVEYVLTKLNADMGGCIEGHTCPLGSYKNDPKYAQFLNNKSTLSTVTNSVMAMYVNKPASTYAAIQDLGDSYGLINKKAYAQTSGIGFAGLSPLLPIWKAFRNLAYLLLSVVLIIIGFMVMFRKKIDPKTVVTVQSAIPGIIITLLLITFSYAIVGFMIDMMYLMMGLTTSILTQVDSVVAPDKLFQGVSGSDLTSGGWGALFNAVFGTSIRTIDDIYKVFFPDQLGYGLTAVGTGTAVSLGLLSILNPIQAVGVVLIAALPLTIILVATIFIWIRLLVALLNAYINIIISLITAPIQLLFGALPGNNSFAAWFTNLLANLLAFPITAAILMISSMLASAATHGQLWVAPMVTSTGFGITGLLSLGFMATIPSILGSVKELLKAKAAVEAGPGAILGPVGHGVGSVMQLGYQASMIASPFLHRQTPSTPQARQTDAQRAGIAAAQAVVAGNPPAGSGHP